MGTNSLKEEVTQLSDSSIQDLLLLYNSSELPSFVTIRYPKDILEHRIAIEKEAAKRGLHVSIPQNIYPFRSSDLQWGSMMSMIDDEQEMSRQTLSPLPKSPNQISIENELVARQLDEYSRHVQDEALRRKASMFASLLKNRPFILSDQDQNELDTLLARLRETPRFEPKEIPLNEDIIMIDFGTAMDMDSIDPVVRSSLNENTQRSSGGDDPNPNGDALTSNGDEFHLSGDQSHTDGDALVVNGDEINKSGEQSFIDGDDLHSSGDLLQDFPSYLKRIEDIKHPNEAKELDFHSFPIEDLNLDEKFQFSRVLKNFRDLFPKLREQTWDVYQKIVAATIWKGPWKREKLQQMSKEQLVAYLEQVDTALTLPFHPASRSRLKIAKDNISQLLNEIDSSDPPTQENNHYPTSEGSGDHTRDEDTLSEIEDQHKNSDQDTVSKALRTKLGKGDYQTIARTTTVTTVRRGKRPMVNRQHVSATIPSNDEHDENQNVSPREKRKSRSPKTKARRKQVSQKGGEHGSYKNGGNNSYQHIGEYLSFLRKIRKEQSKP